jgi:aspartyl-tRNA(Asn)/glutamyl-tRNA(Gln) amidotransferase subunit A
MTRSVGDCAAVLGAIAGEDPLDPTSGRVSVPDYLATLGAGLAGKRIGIDDAYLRQNVELEVLAGVEAAIKTLETLGATIQTVTLPPPGETVPALLGIITPEVTAYHLDWLRERPEDYSQAVRERLELGAITPAVSYIQAQRLRRRITDDALQVMERVDFLVMPTGPTAATPLEGDLVTSEEADPALLAALVNFTGPWDLTGFPAISIPCGFTANGLPIGFQLIGRPYDEPSVLAAAHAYEQATNWHRRLPTVLSG